jgi:curved DNA-binding protein CbpA
MMVAMQDPHTVLGVPADASPEAIGAAYRELARKWHPDRNGGPDAARRMMQINEAHAALRSAAAAATAAADGRTSTARADGAGPATRTRHTADRLSDSVRAALGPELLRALRADEPVVAHAIGFTASSEALIVVTDRRMLWLLNDAVTGRVRSLAFHAIAAVECRAARPRRRRTVLRVRLRNGRRIRFTGLSPEHAAALAASVHPGHHRRPGTRV